MAVQELAGNWYFTFMQKQDTRNNFVKIHGTFGGAREKMIEKFGIKWAFQYSEKEWICKSGKTQEEEFHLTEI